jgi:tetratricopeptide (TPR) repeat protein
MPSIDRLFSTADQLLADADSLDRAQAELLVGELEASATSLPRFADRCYVYQARLLMALQAFEQALLAVEKALLLMPLDDDLLILRGDIYRAAEEYSRALQDYTRVLRQRPDSVTALLHLAEMRQMQGHFGEALIDINEALRHEPRSLRLFYRRGLILVDLGRAMDAMNDFQSVAQLSPPGDLKRKAQQRLRELGAR